MFEEIDISRRFAQFVCPSPVLPLKNMQSTLSDKLGSFLATLEVADTPANKAIWENNTPISFTEELARVRTGITALRGAGAELGAPGTGEAALRKLRADFEEQLHILSRATYQFMKRAGRTGDAAKVNLTPGALSDARAANLAAVGEIVLELAEPLTVPSQPGQPPSGHKDGITATFFAQVDDLWECFATAVGAPAGARSKRKTLTSGLSGQFSAVEEKFSDLDDLIIQFGTTEAGKQFIHAWFNARQVTPLGRQAAKPKATTSVG